MINRINNWYKAAMLALLVFFTPVLSYATPPALELPDEVDLSALFPYIVAIVTALAALIVARKAIKFSNRS